MSKSAILSLAVLVSTLLICLPLVNCATIVRGSSQNVEVKTSPPGATVTVDDENRGVTPVTLTLKKKNRYRVLLSKEGYNDVVVNMDKNFKFLPTIVGNIFSFGIVGIIVDLTTGSAYQLSPEEIDRAFVEATSSLDDIQGRSDEIHIVLMTTEQYAQLRK